MTDSSPHRFAAFAVFLLLATGCGQQETLQPPSLESPSGLAMATRDDCGSASPIFQQFSDGDGPCAIGMIANSHNNRLAFTDLGAREPYLFDLDQTVPGLTHLEVGAHPTDVAASSDGTVGYTLNTVDANISVIDLWRLEVLESPLTPTGAPKALATAPGDQPGGYLLAVTNDPNALWIRRGIHCNESGDGDLCTGLDAEPTQIPLPGRPADIKVSADGQLAYVVYGNRRYMSVFALPDSTALADNDQLACRGARTDAPCEADRIGLTYGCSDGVDNDGDGQVDAADPQCWGPTGAESPRGIGRQYVGACADGRDNDGDGQIDRNDPQCQSNADDSETEPLVEDASFVCSDGEDNDGDGLTDYPDDPDCYGPKGRRESALETTGFSSIAVGEKGVFVYVVDGSKNQVLTVDARRLQLIDAQAAMAPSAAPFSDQLGMPVGGRPMAAAGFVSRNVAWTDPNDPSHGIVHYEFGTFVASDDGRVYTLRTVSADCEVTETNRQQLLSNREFQAGGQAFRNSNERHCLELPEFPIDKPDTSECSDVDTCRACRSPSGEQMMQQACTEACTDFEDKVRSCRTAGRQVEPTDNVTLVANPRFAPGDTRGPEGRIRGGSCTAPTLFVQQMQEYVADNTDAPSVFGCASSLRDQPLTPGTTAEQSEQLEQPSFDQLPRAELLEYVTLQLTPPSDGSGVQATTASRPYDFRLRSEDWSVTWEGVLPDTNREDGLLAPDQPGVLETGALNLCEAGVQEGDRVIIKNSPTTDGPDRCSDFQRPDGQNGNGETTRDNNDPFLTYRVDAVEATTLQLAPISEPGGTNRFADELPVRECFPTAIRYEIRPEDEWIVVGDESGYQSQRTSTLGQCVPKFGADNPRVQGRIETGGVFTGPYLSLQLYDGPVDPIRRRDTEFSYNFGTQRFFSTERTDIETIFPSDMLLTGHVGGGLKLLVSDVSNNFVVVQNLTRPVDDGPIRLR